MLSRSLSSATHAAVYQMTLLARRAVPQDAVLQQLRQGWPTCMKWATVFMFHGRKLVCCLRCPLTAAPKRLSRLHYDCQKSTNANAQWAADFIGYSVRTSQWRYTEWLRFNGTRLHGDFTQVVGRELYDHRGDDGGAHSWDGALLPCRPLCPKNNMLLISRPFALAVCSLCVPCMQSSRTLTL